MNWNKFFRSGISPRQFQTNCPYREAVALVPTRVYTETYVECPVSKRKKCRSVGHF